MQRKGRTIKDMFKVKGIKVRREKKAKKLCK